MKKTKLQTTDDLKRVVEFEAEHAARMLALPNTSWEKAPISAKVTETYSYPGEESTVTETATVEENK